MTRQFPPVFAVAGPIRRWILLSYAVFGILSGAAWMVAVIIVSGKQLTAPALIFLMGFALLIALVVMGHVAVAVAIETAILTGGRRSEASGDADVRVDSQ